jgi:hypothetical protein
MSVSAKLTAAIRVIEKTTEARRTPAGFFYGRKERHPAALRERGHCTGPPPRRKGGLAPLGDLLLKGETFET